MWPVKRINYYLENNLSDLCSNNRNYDHFVIPYIFIHGLHMIVHNVYISLSYMRSGIFPRIIFCSSIIIEIILLLWKRSTNISVDCKISSARPEESPGTITSWRTAVIAVANDRRFYASAWISRGRASRSFPAKGEKAAKTLSVLASPRGAVRHWITEFTKELRNLLP